MKKTTPKKETAKTATKKKGTTSLVGIPSSFNIVTKVSLNGNTITFENQQLNFDGDGKLISKNYAAQTTVKINTTLTPY